MHMSTVSEITKLFLDWAKAKLKSTTLGNYTYHLRKFEKLHGTKETSELIPHDLIVFGTNWHKMQAIQRLFRWAKREAGLIKKDPFKNLKRPSIKKRKRTMTRKECLKLMRAAAVSLRSILLILRETICRPAEARQLRWEQIRRFDESIPLSRSLATGQAVFVIEDHKTSTTMVDSDAPRILVINRRLGRFLARLLQRSPKTEGVILQNSEGEEWNKDSLRQAVRRTCKRAGLVEDYRGERIVAYTFRHSVATAAAIVGVRDKLLADILGHTTTRCTQRYLHLCHEHLQLGMLQIEGGRKARKLI